MTHNYEKNGQLIYNESFATIRSEAKLDHFSADEEVVAVRMIHACGMVLVAADGAIAPLLRAVHGRWDAKVHDVSAVRRRLRV